VGKEDFLRDLIKDRYGSIRKLAAAVGIPASTITSMLKNGVDGTGIGTVTKICRALGISPADLEPPETPAVKEGQNAELAEYIDMLHKRPEMKALFSAARNAKCEDVEKAIKIIEMFKEYDDQWMK